MVWVPMFGTAGGGWELPKSRWELGRKWRWLLDGAGASVALLREVGMAGDSAELAAVLLDGGKGVESKDGGREKKLELNM